MSINETARARIELDGQQANAQLEALRKKASEMRAELNRMRLSKDPGYPAKQREFKNLNGKIKQLSQSSFNLNLTLRNLSGATLRDLTRAQSVLTAQIRNANRATVEGNAAYELKTQQLRQVRAEIARVRGQMTGMTKEMGFMERAAKSMNKYFLMFGAVVSSFVSIIAGMRSTINVFNEFEASVAQLQAITGLAGENLMWLADRAKNASVQMTESGIRFTNSAKEIVDAYTMVGSKRPELLQNKEALAEVTEAAMTLSKAATIDLEPAATALTTVMNQFNVSAKEATRIINTLGAGSKVGAANVSYLNRVIERAGTAAVSANLSIEELVGVIEGVAPRFSQPADAATALRNIFLKLQTLDKDLNPAFVGIDKALENLADRQYTVGELTKLFGIRAVNMAKALIDNREDIQRFTEAVTGTSIAIEQAAINSETNAAKLDQARNKAALLRIELGEKFAPALTFSTNSFSYLLKALKYVIENWGLFRDLIISTTALLVAYNAVKLRSLAITKLKVLEKKRLALILAKNKMLIASSRSITLLYALAKAKLTGNTIKATQALRMLRITMLATPIGAILAGVAALTAAIVLYVRHKRQQTAVEISYNQVMERAEKGFIRQAATLENLKNTIDNTNLSLEKRNEALDELRKIVPGYHASLSEEGELIDNNTSAISAYLMELEKRATSKAFDTQIIEEITKRNQQERILINTEERYNELSEKKAAYQEYGMGLIRAERKELRNLQEARDDATEQVILQEEVIKSINSQHEEYLQSLRDTTDEIDDHTRALELLEIARRNNGLSAEDLREKIQILKQALELVNEETDDYDRILKLLNVTKEQLNAMLHEGNENLAVSINAYQQLSDAIRKAREEMAHLVATGDYEGATNTDAILKNLEANKLVIDGIIEAGGDAQAFIENLSDSTQSSLEETLMFNEMFLENWNDASDEYLERIYEQRMADMQAEQDDHEIKLEYARIEAEEKIRYATEVADAQRKITDALLHHGFDLYSAHLKNEYDQKLNSLNKRMEHELKNENLTKEQQEEIRERYAEQERKLKEEEFKKQKNADIIQSVINTAISVSRALAAPPGFPLNAPTVILAGALGAIQTAAIAAQPVPQFALGKYFTVTGENDRKTYKAPYIGVPQTGIYSQPALFAEQGEELIIDSPTTRNLKINHPEIIEAILNARVPQYNYGKYPPPPAIKQYAEGNLNNADAVSENNARNIELSDLKESIDKLSAVSSMLVSNGVRGVWVYSDLMNMKEKVDRIEKQTDLI